MHVVRCGVTRISRVLPCYEGLLKGHKPTYVVEDLGIAGNPGPADQSQGSPKVYTLTLKYQCRHYFNAKVIWVHGNLGFLFQFDLCCRMPNQLTWPHKTGNLRTKSSQMQLDPGQVPRTVYFPKTFLRFLLWLLMSEPANLMIRNAP